MSPSDRDVAAFRDLVKCYLDVCTDPLQEQRRELWRDHNSLVKTRPPVVMRGGRYREEVPEITERSCEHRLLAWMEGDLRERMYRHALGDDSICEPWLTVRAAHRCRGWGVSGERTHTGEYHGSWKLDYPIREPEDIRKLRPPHHEIDEAATAEAGGKVRDAVGDLIDVHVDRAPAYRVWTGDISTDLHHLRGIENFCVDMMDRPEWLHELLKFMSDGVLRTHTEAEAAGDWSLAEHENQGMPYARELADPAPNTHGAKREDLWVYMAAQEFTLVSPQMHDEFLLQYQIPILKHFGLVSYGCCEDLTRKIDMLRQIPRLRRIAVTPRADVWKCAEQIAGDYVISWRPNPADMVCVGWDPDRVRRIIRDGMEACKGQCVDVILKDIDTVQNDPQRLVEWVKIVRGIVDEYA